MDVDWQKGFMCHQPWFTVTLAQSLTKFIFKKDFVYSEFLTACQTESSWLELDNLKQLVLFGDQMDMQN